MKKKLYIKTALFLTSVALLSSCLKSSPYAVDFAAAKPLVELPGAANVSNTAGTFEIDSISATSSSTPLDIAVNLASPHTLGSALTVGLSVNAAALTAYNTANGTNFVLLPAADYTSTFTAVIPAGQNLSQAVVNIDGAKMTPGVQYVLPITITNGGGQQISNYNTILYEVPLN